MTTKTLNASIVVKLLLASKTIQDVFPDLDKYKEVYKEYATLIHPDTCKEKGASEAMTILNKYKNEMVIGTRYNSDGISYKYAGSLVTVSAGEVILDTIERNYNVLLSLKGKNNEHFQLYLPKTYKRESGSLIFDCGKRIIPLHAIPQPLEQIHANWILSRMLEFSAWINQTKSVVCGLTPDTVFVVPENHGIMVLSLLHLTPVNHKITTISGKFSAFYPDHIFKNKSATTDIDTAMSKRTSLWLLGDKSGVGNILRKTHDQDIINFLQKSSYNPYDSYTEWRNLLKSKFESKFHPLNI